MGKQAYMCFCFIMAHMTFHKLVELIVQGHIAEMTKQHKQESSAVTFLGRDY